MAVKTIIKINEEESVEVTLQKNVNIDDPNNFVVEVDEGDTIVIPPPPPPTITNLASGSGESSIKVKLTFDYDLNKSLQVGDTIWYVPTSSAGGHSSASTNNSNFALLGNVISVSHEYRKSVIEVDYSGFDLPQDLGLTLDKDTFIMFSKNKVVNSSALKGYYAELQFVNDSDQKIELFAVGSEISQSSK
tara:strand:- start:220 stop:789 length:570 start_codon:yes stop_codon:yes gene_type:complete